MTSLMCFMKMYQCFKQSKRKKQVRARLQKAHSSSLNVRFIHFMFSQLQVSAPRHAFQFVLLKSVSTA